MNIKNLFNKFVNASLGLILALTASVVSAAQTEVTYYVPDALGSPIAAMDAAGNIKWRKHYRPFGEEIEQGTEAQDNRIGYTGHVHDSDTALTYMGARYYDPQIGRFLSLDPVGVDPNDPRTFNRYAYANNNPYRYVDPDGRTPAHVAVGVGVILYLSIAVLPGHEERVDSLQQAWASWNENAGDDGEHNGSNEPIKAPDLLPAFPDAKPVKPKTSIQGGGGKRDRWKDKKGKIFEWDSRHGTVEQYDKTGKKHLGEFDPNTGKQVKPPNKERSVEK